MEPLQAISPIDGRYRKITEPLAKYFSEAALFRYRIMVECEYFVALSEIPGIRMRTLTAEEIKTLHNLYESFSEADARLISEIETQGYKDTPATNHDVKAVEYFIKEKLKATSLSDLLEWIHFALTSEDVNNLAYGLIITDSLGDLIYPAYLRLQEALLELAKKYKDLPMLARTHGQPASPTTFGKEFKVFASRLERQTSILKNLGTSVKLNGATGNYNAHLAAFPKINWPEFSLSFLARFNQNRSFRLNSNLITTQIEPHDSYVEIFDCLRRINTILIGFNQDMWRYISDDWIVQKTVPGEIGSSAMPHKVNPIKFENSEGNLASANALFEFFARKLPISRLQRDLSDSTIERQFGTAFAHSLLGYEYILKGLERMEVNEEKVGQALHMHPEVIAEAIQTILRREGVAMPYEKLKELTRGRTTTMEDFTNFIDNLEVDDKIKKELHKITPENYTGLASTLVDL